MDNLTYKIEVFEGPMDLLLHLISKHKLNINDIPIVELVNQYLDYVRQMEEADFDVAGDFLEMAARLIYIKTDIIALKIFTFKKRCSTSCKKFKDSVIFMSVSFYKLIWDLRNKISMIIIFMLSRRISLLNKPKRIDIYIRSLPICFVIYHLFNLSYFSFFFYALGRCGVSPLGG